MRILLLILIPFICRSQITDDVKHHYAGVGVTVTSGIVMYKITKNKFLAGLTGLTCGILAGIAKEEIYDRKWHKGVPSDMDKLNTGWGACVGTIYLEFGLSYYEHKKYPDKYYDFSDTLKTN